MAATVDLLYVAFNRLAFTKESFTRLKSYTDWDLVRRFYVYDDGSTDGTKEWLMEAVEDVPAEVEFRHTIFGGPIGVMRDFIESAEAPILAKIDNDAVVMPQWLYICHRTMEDHPELDVLGIEGYQGTPSLSVDPDSKRGYVRTQAVGGLALIRRKLFQSSTLRPISDIYSGWWYWQRGEGASAVKGWLNPSIPVFVLDRIPFDPWNRLSREYVDKAWQRPWWKYNAVQDKFLWQWWRESLQIETTMSRPVHAQDTGRPRIYPAPLHG